MQWNNKFSYPKSMRSTVSGSRMYAVNQEKLPSVTSILQATQSEEKKASLANWKARVGVKEANRIKNEASNRGTSMHAFLEKYLLGQLNLELLEESGLDYTFFAPGFMWHAGKQSDDTNVKMWIDRNDKMWRGLVCTYEDIGYAIAKEAVNNNLINKKIGIESSDQYWLSLFKGSLIVANWQLNRWSNFHH